jgi:hypothetical protein
MCGRQERLAHLGAVAGGMPAEVVIDNGAFRRLLGWLRYDTLGDRSTAKSART